MKVCYVVTLASAGSRYGGPFDVIREQAALVARAGHDVELVAGYTGDDEGPALRAGRSSYRLVRPWLPTRDFTALLSFGMLRQLWRSVGRADVVHVSLAREAVPVAALAIARVRRRPVVAQPHGMLTSRTSRAHDALDRVLRPLYRGVAHWFALTTVEERDLRGRLGSAIRESTAIGNPVSIDADDVAQLRATAPAPERSAVFIARLHPRKHVLDFAAAASVAAAHGWPDRYRVFGPDQGDLEALLAEAATTPALEYDGALDPDVIPAYLTTIGAFVLTSADEPWGNVLATAVTLGVPSVLTRSSALAADLDGVAGVRIVPDGDATAIAVAVHDALEQGHVAPSTIFDRTVLLHRVERILERVVSRSAEGRPGARRAAA